MIKRYQVRGFDLHEYECDGGIWCRWSDVEPITAERDDLKRINNALRNEIDDANRNRMQAKRDCYELKRKLAVFTDGMPTQNQVPTLVRALKAEKHSGHYVGDDWDTINAGIEWLRRIAEVSK